ncbi:MAG TPA: hypothetical protein VN857_13200 [Chthoniobacterales bacterium]|nr:hypothetical protein [Chthoniobacterales bacterium]
MTIEAEIRWINTERREDRIQTIGAAASGLADAMGIARLLDEQQPDNK